jgi:hypothetical protein
VPFAVESARRNALRAASSPHDYHQQRLSRPNTAVLRRMPLAVNLLTEPENRKVKRRRACSARHGAILGAERQGQAHDDNARGFTVLGPELGSGPHGELSPPKKMRLRKCIEQPLTSSHKRYMHDNTLSCHQLPGGRREGIVPRANFHPKAAPQTGIGDRRLAGPGRCRSTTRRGDKLWP